MRTMLLLRRERLGLIRRNTSIVRFCVRTVSMIKMPYVASSRWMFMIHGAWTFVKETFVTAF